MPFLLSSNSGGELDLLRYRYGFCSPSGQASEKSLNIGHALPHWPLYYSVYSIELGFRFPGATDYASIMRFLDMSAHPRRWIWVPAIWLGFGIIDATQAIIRTRSDGMHYAWARLFFISVIQWIPWVAATLPVMRLNDRFPVTRWRFGVTWFIHIPALIICNIVVAAWYTFFERLLNPYNETPPLSSYRAVFVESFLSIIVASILLYGAIVAIDTILDSRASLAQQRAETSRLNEQLSQAQLDALRRQMEPHFLFNTLNSVSALIREQRDEAALIMIAGLSDFLRRLLADTSRHQVALAEEMEFAQKYLDIQKVRFADRLKFDIHVPPDLLVAQVPTFILQILLENAIKHGIARRAQGGNVRILASRNNGTLTLSVYNDGPPILSGETIPSGIGLTNMRTRLQGLYGDAFDLHLRNQHPHGVEVSVSLPFIQ